jgi:3-hydroxyacyl-[acyl-carrier-protein] dehydratase
LEEIKKVLPHRYPFLMIDGISEVEAGKTAIGFKNVLPDEYYFQGHFPGSPVMPGVLIIEAIAQVGAFAVLYDERYKGSILLFTGIKKAKFRRKVLPGDILKIEVKIEKIKMNNGTGWGIATVNGQKAAEAEFTFYIESRQETL